MTPQRRARSVLAVLERVLPRIAGTVLGLVLARAGGGVLSAVGVVVFVLSVMTNPARWWHYVLTGAKREAPPAAEFSEAGVCSVELQDSGTRPVEVIKALREVTGAGFSDAKATVATVPAMIAERLSEGSAQRVRDRVVRAGATAVIVTTGDR